MVPVTSSRRKVSATLSGFNEPGVVDVWWTVTDPSGAVVETLVTRDVTLSGLQTRISPTLDVAGSPGQYRIDTYAGDYDTGVIVGTEALPVSKIGEG